MNSTIFIITNIAPLYRSILWEYLLINDRYHFNFFFGKEVSSGIKTIDYENPKLLKFSNQLHYLKNRYFLKKILFWQGNLLSKCLSKSPKAVIITGDFYIISNWVAAIIFRLKKVRVIFWSHGFYGNEKFLKKNIRKLFYSLANDHLLYERRGKKNMISNGFSGDNVHVVFNSLDYPSSLSFRNVAKDLEKGIIYDFFLDPNLPTLIFVGRLTKIKKLDLLIKAVTNLKKSGNILNLLIVGDGEEKSSLMNLTIKCKIEKNCHFYGPCYSEDKLSKLIAKADLCVSPGNVGLTAIHSLSYGTPVLTHGNFVNQMPEVGVIIPGFNGLFFEENNLQSMSDSIATWIFINSTDREEIRKNCFKIIDRYYNPDYQVKVIENLLDNNPPML